MLTKHDIYSKINHDLHGPVGDLCRVVVDFLTSKEAKSLKHITYVSLVNGTKLDVQNNDAKVLLIKVTDYLSSNRMHLLDMHFQYIESDDSDPIPVDDWICPYISRHLLSLNPLLACCRRYSRGER